MPACHNTARTKPYRAWLLYPAILLLLGVSACAPETPVETVDTVSPETGIDTTLNSTAIVNHRAPDGFKFAQFNEYQIQIHEESAAHLGGDYYVIKVFRGDQTFYLGKHPSMKDIRLLLSLPVTLTSVSIEIFTNHPQSDFVAAEITL